MSIVRLIRQRTERGRDQDGSILILVLAIVIGVVLVLSAILGFAQSGLTTSVGYRFHRNVTYYTDGTMDGAINSLRGSPASGLSNPCTFPGGSSTFSPSSATDPADEGAGSPNVYSVGCQALPGSGGNPALNQPQYAILTLGPGASDGIRLHKNNALHVNGSVYSSGPLTLDSGEPNLALDVSGGLTAASCSPYSGPPHVVSGSTACGGPTFTPATDPGYAPEVPGVSGLAAVDPPASCGSPAVSSRVVTFSPGLYTEPPSAPSGCTSPTNNVWWFQPGVYYFDFQPAALGSWQPPAGVDIVGGSASGFTSLSSSSSVSFTPPALPCLPPTATDSGPAGIQIILGGVSTITLASTNKMVLCSNSHTSSQEIAVYALESGTRTPVTGTATACSCGNVPGVLHPNSAANSLAPSLPFVPGGAYTLGAALHDIGDSEIAKASLVPSSSATVTTSNYDATIPPGSEITSVQVAIAHGESDPEVKLSGTISFAGQPPSKLDSPGGPLQNCAGSCTQNVDVTGDLPADFAYKALDGDPSTPKVTVTYTAQEPNNGNPLDTETLDGINLVVNYLPPGFEKMSCASNPCTVLQNNPQGSSQNMYFHGTVYAPSSALAVTVQNLGTTIFDRGVVAQTLDVYVSASSKQIDAPFSLPRPPNGNRIVLFTASVSGVPKLRAVATYQDWAPSPAAVAGTVELPGYRVIVSNWSVLR